MRAAVKTPPPGSAGIRLFLREIPGGPALIWRGMQAAYRRRLHRPLHHRIRGNIKAVIMEPRSVGAWEAYGNGMKVETTSR